MGVDGLDVGAEIEDAAYAGDDRGEVFDVGEANGDAEALVLGEVGYGDGSEGAIDLDGAVVGSLLDDFNAGDCTRVKIAEHGIPVVGWAVAESERYSGVGLDSGGFAAQRVGWTVEEILECFVESPDASESGCEGDFGHGHPGFVDELLGEEHAAGLRDGDGGGSEMLVE